MFVIYVPHKFLVLFIFDYLITLAKKYAALNANTLSAHTHKSIQKLSPASIASKAF